MLSAVLTGTPVFNMAFRYNAGRALMMGVRKAARQPLWLQRLRAAEMLDALAGEDGHPLIRETRRECLEDYWDLEGVEAVLTGIRNGTIRIREMDLDLPSPLSYPLRQQTEAAMMYDYAPTTPGIQHAAAQALERAQGIAPDPERLASQSVRRTRLPANENELHSLLMIEGDLIAGEVDVPVEWLDRLAREGRAAYVEPGLWIAAEHREEYDAALAAGEEEARGHIVRRALRYRGGMTAEQVADRYLWTADTATSVLAGLCRAEAAVESDGVHYHAELYEKARRETIRSRRAVRTLPPERYAALLAGRLLLTAPPAEKLEYALRSLAGLAFPAALWETVLLPARVGNYRPELLDQLLAQGNWFWRMEPGGLLGFHPYEDLDWDAGPGGDDPGPEGDGKPVYDALLRRGASFMHRLTGLPGEDAPGFSLQDILMRLAEEGRVCADSFVPIRQWLERDRLDTAPAKQRARVRALAQTAGRWDLTRPPRALTPEELLDRVFDRAAVLSRETVQGLPWAGPGVTWSQALEILRVWEYTGRARRGYFIEGLSGIQFIREKDYTGVMAQLEESPDRIQWLSAADPAQPWGKSLPHRPDRMFLNVPGTVVALRAGLPAAVLERQGRTLRVFDPDVLPDALAVLVNDFSARRVLPGMSRLTVREYPSEAAGALAGAGFVRELQDYVAYRRYR